MKLGIGLGYSPAKLIIPKEDIKALYEIGVGKLFGPGTPVDTTIEYIKNWVNDNRN